MNYFKMVLTISVALHPLMLLSVRPIVFKGATGAMTGASMVGIGITYQKGTREIEHAAPYEVDRKYEAREKSVKRAIGLGIAATAMTAAVLHRQLPLQRIARAQTIHEKVKEFSLVRPYRDRNHFFETLEEEYLRNPFPYVTAFNDLVEKDECLSKSSELVSAAKADFTKDGDMNAEDNCTDLQREIGGTTRAVQSLIHMIKQRPDFNKRVGRFERVQAANRQAQATKDAADAAEIIAVASVVSAANSFRHK